MTYDKWRHRLARANNPGLIPITHIDELLASEQAQVITMCGMGPDTVQLKGDGSVACWFLQRNQQKHQGTYQ